MNILIRVDSSEQIGSGHLARCLALAEELRSQKANVVFASRDLPGNMLALLKTAGFGILPLCGSRRRDDEGRHEAVGLGVLNQQDDAAACISQAKTLNAPVGWLLVDHYGIDQRWEALLRPHVGQIAVIDDLANREHHCDLLIDTNLHPEGAARYADKVPNGCIQLQGPGYALLRREFPRERALLYARKGEARSDKVRRILVFFGGVDLSNQTLKALKAIASLDRNDISTDVVVGATNPNREQVRDFCRMQAGFNYHCQTAEMAKLMGHADLAIGAGGTTMWERCAMGLPSIVITVADNQVPSTVVMAQEGRLHYLGSHRSVDQARIAQATLSLLENREQMLRLSARSAELVDGQGTDRVARCLMTGSIPANAKRSNPTRVNRDGTESSIARDSVTMLAAGER